MTIITGDLNLAIKFLDEGKVICYPTDTVYGIGCRINFPESIKRIFEIKKRDFAKPLSIAIHDLNAANEFVKLDDEMEKFIKQHSDKPYTFIVPKTDKISDIISANKDVVGIRIINDERVKALNEKYPIITTSANISSEPSAKNFEEIDEGLKNAVDLVLTGECKYKVPSTIINLRNFKVIRE
ncbi:MAG: threonylcarbamoyl-AMP synthase [Candidatus Altiarchaeales archaeon A3]|nr:MAG: threonylcarbamoyl-AMP synthase [Candidatus Altiarchaeales archaeon A3]